MARYRAHRLFRGPQDLNFERILYGGEKNGLERRVSAKVGNRRKKMAGRYCSEHGRGASGLPVSLRSLRLCGEQKHIKPSKTTPQTWPHA
jgi:hypothetical protein